MDNKDAIVNYLCPKKSDGIKRFLGIVNYYRKFIKSCATIQGTIFNLTRENIEFDWSNECEDAFERLKKSLGEYGTPTARFQ